MAAGVSGSVSFTSDGKTLRVYYAQTFTPGVAKSTVTISRVTLQCDVDYSRTFYFDGKIIVNGQTVYSRSLAASDGAVTVTTWEDTINLCTGGKITVNHSAATDITIQLDENTQGGPYFYNASGNSFYINGGTRTVTLSAIPMASSISAGAVTLGSKMTVSLTKAAAGMKDTVTWKCGTQSGTIAENSTGTKFTWTPPVSLASQAPSGTSVRITLTTATKNGNTDAGSSSVTVSCPIPASVKPTVSLAVSDETGYLSTFGSYIRSQSKARVVTKAAGAYGSSITGISVTCGSLNGTGASILFSLPYAGTVVIRVTVTDSRGRTAAAEEKIYVADYSPPVPGITELYRCDASGAAAPDGAWAKAVLACAVTSLGGLNTAACVLRYRVRGTEDWTEKTVAVPGEAVFPADTGSDYQVRLTAADSFVAVSGDILPLPAAFALLDFDRKNNAAGIGQRAGTAGTLSIGLPIKMGTNRITDMGAPTDSADAATKEYVDAAVTKAAPRNLLDNSDFTNLIAQAGYMGNHGATVYFADRWFKTANTPSYDPVTRTITFNPDGLSIIDQKVGHDVAGKKLTLAIKASSVNGAVALTEHNAQSGHANVPINTGITVHTFVGGDNTFVRFFSSSGGSIVVDWMALYEGEYTAENLPEYRPKGYGAELAECQRYYYRILSYWKWFSSGICVSATQAMIPIILPQAMRIMPTVTIADKSLVRVRCGSVASQVPSEITWSNLTSDNSRIQMAATVTGATNGNVAMLYLDNGACIEFSADL